MASFDHFDAEIQSDEAAEASIETHCIQCGSHYLFCECQWLDSEPSEDENQKDNLS